MSVIMYRLKQNGRAAVILPDGFLFGTDNAKIAIKEKLLSEFNLHTIIRMPHSVFAPYTSITTNILFFDRTHPTTETWFYRLDMPEGYKNFSKTKPMKLEHFAPTVEWWDNREEITIGGFDKAKKYTVEELKARSYNIDLCGYPHEEEEILPPKELIQQYQEKRASLNADIDRILCPDHRHPWHRHYGGGRRMTAQQLKNSILLMAVQGKLVPQDPNDEPASVLLERIRTEKERLIKEKKIKREKNPSVIFKGADNTPYEKIGDEVRSLADEVPFDIPDSWEVNAKQLVIRPYLQG